VARTNINSGTSRILLGVLTWLFITLESVRAQTNTPPQPFAASLDAHMDGLLQEMTVQEKIEQRFCKTADTGEQSPRPLCYRLGPDSASVVCASIGPRSLRLT
jgi:hypothetical protein